MVQYLHIDVDQRMIQKMLQYSHADTIEDGSKDEATDCNIHIRIFSMITQLNNQPMENNSILKI